MKNQLLNILFVVYFIFITGSLDFFHTCDAGKICCHHEGKEYACLTGNFSVSSNSDSCFIGKRPHKKQNHDIPCHACYLSKISNSPLNPTSYFVNYQSVFFFTSSVTVFYCQHNFSCFNIRAPPAPSRQV